MAEVEVVDLPIANDSKFSRIKVCALTTFDNPFDPFTRFDEWFDWDTKHGYNTSELVARFTRNSLELSAFDNAAAKEEAIDQILWVFKGSGIYKKIEIWKDISFKNEMEGEGA